MHYQILNRSICLFHTLLFIILFKFNSSAPLTSNVTYDAFINDIQDHNCSFRHEIRLPFNSKNTFEYLQIPLNVCKAPQSIKRHREALNLCSEIFDILKNITCSNQHPQLPEIYVEFSRDVCSDIASMKFPSSDVENLLKHLKDKLVCEMLCDDEFNEACKVLLWGYTVQQKVINAVDDSENKKNDQEKQIKSTKVEEISSNSKLVNEEEKKKNQSLNEENTKNYEEKSTVTDTQTSTKAKDASPISNEIEVDDKTMKETLLAQQNEGKNSSTNLPITNAQQQVKAGKQDVEGNTVPVDTTNLKSKQTNESPSLGVDVASSGLASENENQIDGKKNTEELRKENELHQQANTVKTEENIQDLINKTSSTTKAMGSQQTAFTKTAEKAEEESTVPVDEPTPEKTTEVKDKSTPMKETDKTSPSQNDLEGDKPVSAASDKQNATQSEASNSLDLSQNTVPQIVNNEDEIPPVSTSADLESMEDGNGIPEPVDKDPYNDVENEGDYAKEYEDEDGFDDSLKKKVDVEPSKVPEPAVDSQNDFAKNFLPSRNAIRHNIADDLQMIPSFPEQEDSHFFFYFLTIVLVLMAGYLLFHNKQKIIALIVEGRHERRRRSHGVGYRKLETK